MEAGLNSCVESFVLLGSNTFKLKGAVEAYNLLRGI